MAVNIDKSVSQAPKGVEELAGVQPDLSIEIENPESVTLDEDRKSTRLNSSH